MDKRVTPLNQQKICRIVNGQHSWYMDVDFRRIYFQGFDAALYFADHYRKLGYRIEEKDENRNASESVALRAGDELQSA